jgi:hypothetical protein
MFTPHGADWSVCGLLRCETVGVLQANTNVSKEHATSFFRNEMRSYMIGGGGRFLTLRDVHRRRQDVDVANKTTCWAQRKSDMFWSVRHTQMWT